MSNILRWVMFIPASLVTVFVMRFIEGYLTDLADSSDNFIMKWIIAIAYSFFLPVIIIFVGVEIAPKFKSIISKLMSICLIVMFSYFIYMTSQNPGHFLEYFSLIISILGCIVVFFVGEQE
jgi:hypothetical protein